MSYRLFLLAVVAFGMTVAPTRAQDEPPKADPKKAPEFKVQERGPIHEAFAQPWEKNPTPNEAIKQKPPDPIPEEPPDQKPAGENVQWIPGYWQYDAEVKDFIWVSGTWRKAPEDRRWVPGFWTETQEGYRYINGHWAAKGEQDQQFVPTPPQSVDNGPNSPAPDDQSFYIPGSWFYTDVGWRWRPGYWADVRPGYTWYPASYYWTPNGWTFSNGYWDYDPFDRGLLFAPVYFPGGYYYRPGFLFRPGLALAARIVFDVLFFRYGWGHYYWGNYYGGFYAGFGFRPWGLWGPRYYDPLYAGLRFSSRGGPGYLTTLQTNAQARTAGQMANAGTTAPVKAPSPVMPLADVAKSGVKMQTVTATQRQAITAQSQALTTRSTEMMRTTSQLRVSSEAVPRIGASVNGRVQSGVNFPGVSGAGQIHSNINVNPGQFNPHPGTMIPNGGIMPHSSGGFSPGHSAGPSHFGGGGGGGGGSRSNHK